VIRTHIMVHHSLTKDSGTVSWAAIQRYHVETMGWADVSYHAGVELVNPEGEVEAFLGRDWTQQAAACPQGEMNRRALHVCVVGNYDLVAPSDEHLRVLVKRVLLPWMNLFGIGVDRIVGHRDYNASKTCPGTLFSLDNLRRMVR
jgi:N-acetylmuramoyl-L-alanine amidase